jgi:hypothetical protein
MYLTIHGEAIGGNDLLRKIAGKLVITSVSELRHCTLGSVWTIIGPCPSVPIIPIEIAFVAIQGVVFKPGGILINRPPAHVIV